MIDAVGYSKLKGMCVYVSVSAFLFLMKTENNKLKFTSL